TSRFMPHCTALGASKVMVSPAGGVNHQTKTDGASQVVRTIASSAPANIQVRTRRTALSLEGGGGPVNRLDFAVFGPYGAPLSRRRSRRGTAHHQRRGDRGIRPAMAGRPSPRVHRRGAAR